VVIFIVRYLVDVSPELADDINKQVKTGKYKSVQDFILAALQNQVYIETSENTDNDSQTSTSSGLVNVLRGSTVSLSAKTAEAQLLLKPEPSNVKTVPLGNVPRPTYLWGQYNRLFPVKIVVRVAANLSRQNGFGFVPLGELQERTAEIAREMGRTILRKDRLLGRKRGTIISAALPIGRDQEKAKARFKNQFVGFLARSRVEGAAPTLKFLGIMRNDKNVVQVGITDLGLRFASLSNPIIDRDDYSTAFSPEEIEFLLDHIASEVPAEAKLVQLVLDGVKRGVDTPEELNDLVRSYNAEWNESEAIAMRSGIVSRASELGLLERRKDGVKVTYLLSEPGKKYLEKLKGMEM
jgi:hypothetical protein